MDYHMTLVDHLFTTLRPALLHAPAVLAGMSPDLIMDICSRALLFYLHQLSQDVSVSAAMADNANDKCKETERLAESLATELNASLGMVQEKNAALLQEQKMARTKVQELTRLLHEKNRQFQRLQAMYETQKRKYLSSTVQKNYMAGNSHPQLMATAAQMAHVVSVAAVPFSAFHHDRMLEPSMLQSPRPPTAAPLTALERLSHYSALHSAATDFAQLYAQNKRSGPNDMFRHAKRASRHLG
ncbi:hypothetical protein Unana1_02164 [Umbelopsis nana]